MVCTLHAMRRLRGPCNWDCQGRMASETVSRPQPTMHAIMARSCTLERSQVQLSLPTVLAKLAFLSVAGTYTTSTGSHQVAQFLSDIPC